MKHLSVAAGQHRSDFCADETLVDIFSATAAVCPDKIAYYHQNEAISYAELHERSTCLAKTLIKQGLQPGSFVGILMTRSFNFPIAVMAVLKAGCVFMPFDPEANIARVNECAREANASLVLIDTSTRSRVAGLSLPLFEVDNHSKQFTSLPNIPLPPISQLNPAYVIFTSGSTGKPKGVVISHRNACHWIRAENALLGITKHDVVYQGFSPAFDMSIEEVWTAYLVGATLVMCTLNGIRQADELPLLITKHGITVVHGVPSFINVVADHIIDMTSLRLINLGGEACPPTLLKRLELRNVRLVNSYGPTETTVSATMGDLYSGEEVSIGKLLPNYTAYVVDENMVLRPRNLVGELLIGGPSVGKGYINRPDLTASRFILNPFIDRIGWNDPMLYRTGDMVKMDANDRLFYVGRVDNQVKICGYRIELEEVEARLASLPNVTAAVATTHEFIVGQPELVAFVTVNPDIKVSPDELKQALKQNLPDYMVPTRLAIVTELPHLTSSKIDRKNLPFSRLTEVTQEDVDAVHTDLELTSTESAVKQALKTVFPGMKISLDADFFNDLPGHSLAMANLVSILRTRADLSNANLQQVYSQRTGRKLAAALTITHAEIKSPQPQSAPIVKSASRTLCAVAQAIFLFFIYGFLGALIAGPFLTYSFIDEYTNSFALSMTGAAMTVFTLPTLVMLISIGSKWLIIGRYVAGDYPLWGSYYLRHWIVSTLFELVPKQYLANTPLYNRYCRLIGMKIGAEVHLAGFNGSAPDLITIGAQSSIGTGVHMDNITFTTTTMSIRPITIGENVYVGSGSIISGDCVIENNAELADMAHLQKGCRMTAGSMWEGSPARQVGQTTATRPQMLSLKPWFVIREHLLYTFLCATFPLIALLPVAPIVWILNELDKTYPDNNISYLIYAAPCLSLLYILLFIAILVGLKWLVLGRAKAGTYSIHSSYYYRKWYVDQLYQLSLDILHPLFATLYLPPLYRLLGAKVGWRAEISTATTLTHDLVNIGDESFIADGVMLADPPIRHNTITLAETSLGNRTFAGNASCIPQGCAIPDGCLIGVFSVPPHKDVLVKQSTWCGIPSLLIPQREQSQYFDEKLTFKPSRLRVLARLMVEGLRILLPIAVILSCIVLLISTTYEIVNSFGILAAALSFPLLYLAIVALPALIVTLALKWILIGRYTAGQHPLWTPYVWLSEAVTSTYESLSVPLFLNFLEGTPFLPVFLRLFGTKIGKNTLLNMTDVTEFDMVTIGDGVVMNKDCGSQTHLFEDHVMKIGPVDIGNNAVIGMGSIILYNSKMGAECFLAPQSLVMKGEQLPAYTAWTGSPAQAL